jgi:hypothetical protein
MDSILSFGQRGPGFNSSQRQKICSISCHSIVSQFACFRIGDFVSVNLYRCFRLGFSIVAPEKLASVFERREEVCEER